MVRTINGYRYGFQGQETDDEIKGKGNSVNYKYRMHDPRIGRFFAVDPLIIDYPYYTSYSFSGNRVIDALELEGLEPVVMHGALIGYIVQPGQGYWGIAQDINSIESQATYGYSQDRKVTAREIEMINLEHNGISKGHVLQPDEIITSVTTLWQEGRAVRQIDAGITQIDWYEEQIPKMQEKIEKSKARRAYLDGGPTRRENDPLLQSHEGYAEDAYKFQKIGLGVIESVEHIQLQIEEHALMNKITAYKKQIEVNKKLIGQYQDVLNEIRKVIQDGVEDCDCETK